MKDELVESIRVAIAACLKAEQARDAVEPRYVATYSGSTVLVDSHHPLNEPDPDYCRSGMDASSEITAAKKQLHEAVHRFFEANPEADETPPINGVVVQRISHWRKALRKNRGID